MKGALPKFGRHLNKERALMLRGRAPLIEEDAPHVEALAPK